MPELNSSLNKQRIAYSLWKLAYPTMISTGLQSFYDFVDMLWIGQISKHALSGVAIFSSLYMIFGILNDVAGSSSVSMISQNYGRGDIKKTCRIAEQTISFKVVLAIISGILLSICLPRLLKFFVSDERVIQSAFDYGGLRILFMPIIFSSFSVNTIFRCTGDAKMPMFIMIISASINLVLDPVLMFDVIPGTNIPGFGLGVFGASLATVISITISFLIGFFVLLKGRKGIKLTAKGLLSLDKEIDKNLLFIGLPSGINSFVRTLSQVIVLKFVAVYGSDAIAISGVGAKFIQFIFMPLFGFNMGGSTLVGHSLGRENIPEAKLTSKISAFLSFLVILLLTLIVYIFGEFLVSFFFPGNLELIKLAALMLKIVFPSFLIVAIVLGLATVFSGSGHVRPMLYAMIASRWLTQIPYLFLTVSVLKLPLYFVWFGFGLGEIAELFVVIYHYRKGVWQHKRV